ncbi:hypothetical protein LTR10_018571 [Elasticomyces elasticus]|uniref:Fe2OG dioxygenase domain-containing protein n=1 Tax=Exophiala sideris TaxID=1016849 RepID=A0ABR0JNH8_9EURO|nr:hypothetical protein LTR10_018571 [Elasticomyces elasticus]KAK5038052.1 hypothetical protein LTS07_001520 [Exophiala sideris]KAK5044034.1 hypothetical protein LTR13_000390 [Exophiala sideris]KAK5067533.1 hypothetical protein LTR69_001522 [Exophiala sideris]KAK5184228.1 hypothetical protein LTR44_003734 [Eurotiomycetes sp. CCFEE 6388]
MTTAAPRKRKTLHEYFDRPTQTSIDRPQKLAVLDLPIPGLTLIPELISRDEETALLSFLEKEHWRTDLNRRCIHYGGTYCLMPPRDASAEERKRIESTIFKADPIPVEVNFIVDKMMQRGLYDGKQRPAFCIVNEYIGTQGISAHVENFRFDSPVCGLTMGNGDSMRFHELVNPDDASVRSGGASKVPRTGKKQDVWLPPRSLLVMNGEARTKWQHEVRHVKRPLDFKRVSLTFRTEKSSAR